MNKNIYIFLALLIIVLFHMISINNMPVDPGDESYYIILSKSLIEKG